MELKDGKQLSKLALIKRLNLMNVDYNPNLLDKQYYIDLYNKEIQSLSNQKKIQNELERDQMYTDYLNQNLCKKKECSLNFPSNNNFSNKTKLYENNFFSDFDTNFCVGVLLANFCMQTYDKFKDRIDYQKILLPIQAIKKYTAINLTPKIKKVFMEIVNFINDYMKEKYDILIYLILVIIFYLMTVWQKKRLTNKNNN